MAKVTPEQYSAFNSENQSVVDVGEELLGDNPSMSLEGPSYAQQYKKENRRGTKGNKGGRRISSRETGVAPEPFETCYNDSCDSPAQKYAVIKNEEKTHFAPVCHSCAGKLKRAAVKKGLPIDFGKISRVNHPQFKLADQTAEENDLGILGPFTSPTGKPIMHVPKDRYRNDEEAGKFIDEQAPDKKFKSTSGTGKPGSHILNSIVEAMDPEGIAGLPHVIAHRIAQIPDTNAPDSTKKLPSGKEVEIASPVTIEQLDSVPAHPKSATEAPEYVNRALFEVRGRRGELNLGLGKK
jgi:hypothetical protein